MLQTFLKISSCMLLFVCSACEHLSETKFKGNIKYASQDNKEALLHELQIKTKAVLYTNQHFIVYTEAIISTDNDVFSNTHKHNVYSTIGLDF